MTTHPEGYVKKDTLWFVALIALAFGFLAGIVFSVYKAGPPSPASQQSAPQTAAQAPDTQAVLALEKEVQANPNNYQAWTQLGNYYFDSNNFNKAIEAYKKSLAIHPDDPNVLTDLGVMYRSSGNPTEALASFDRALAINPDHPTARFNRGVVQFYDLKDREGAIKTWEELVKRHPDAKAPNGQLISELIATVKAQK